MITIYNKLYFPKPVMVFFAVIICSFTVYSQTTHHIAVKNAFFDPPELTIKPGDTVVWTNASGFHNVNGTNDSYPENPESFGNSTGQDWVYSFVFDLPGIYDYHCDPHLELGMTGEITVVEDASLTVQFEDMEPHVGQRLKLYLYDLTTSAYIDSVIVDPVTEAGFELTALDITPGNSYNLDFFADFNENGMYDAPPTDHAWRLKLNHVMGDTTVTFAHNANFTDIFASDEPNAIINGQATNNVGLYPNPTSDFVNLQVSGLRNSKVEIRLTNIKGQVVMSVQRINTVRDLRLNISHLPEGLYFVEIQSGYDTAISKLIINR